jgi:hypothetical protein
MASLDEIKNLQGELFHSDNLYDDSLININEYFFILFL